jgi:hypothetical protein
MAHAHDIAGRQAPVAAVAKIEIVLLSNGKVQAQASVPGREALLMMMETAKYDLERLLYEKEKAAAEQQIEIPNKGLLVAG